MAQCDAIAPATRRYAVSWPMHWQGRQKTQGLNRVHSESRQDAYEFQIKFTAKETSENHGHENDHLHAQREAIRTAQSAHEPLSTWQLYVAVRGDVRHRIRAPPQTTTPFVRSYPFGFGHPSQTHAS